jgi:hypothetical protein
MAPRIYEIRFCTDGFISGKNGSFGGINFRRGENSFCHKIILAI